MIKQCEFSKNYTPINIRRIGSRVFSSSSKENIIENLRSYSSSKASIKYHKRRLLLKKEKIKNKTQKPPLVPSKQPTSIVLSKEKLFEKNRRIVRNQILLFKQQSLNNVGIRGIQYNLANAKRQSPINSRIADRLPLNLETGMIDASCQAERSLMDTDFDEIAPHTIQERSHNIDLDFHFMIPTKAVLSK